MAVYRNVHVSFWQDTWVMSLTPEEKYFYLYLMTNTRTKQCGVYELPYRIIEFETGYNTETVEKLMQRFIEYGKVRYNKDTQEVMLTNWGKYNKSKSPKVVRCIEKEVNEIKCLEFKKYCCDTLSIEWGEEREEEEEKEKPEETARDWLIKEIHKIIGRTLNSNEFTKLPVILSYERKKIEDALKIAKENKANSLSYLITVLQKMPEPKKPRRMLRRN